MTQTAESCSPNSNSYHHGNLRQALLDAAVDAIRESGPENLSLRAIARRVGVSQTAPYRHFADKNDLLAELARQGFDDITRFLTDQTESQATPAARLQQAATAYISYAIKNPEKYRLIFGNHVARRTDYSELKASGRRCSALFQNLITDGIHSGDFIAADPIILFNTCLAAIHGFAFLCIDGTFERLEQAREAQTCAETSSGLNAASSTVNDQLIQAQVKMMVRSIARQPDSI